MSLIGEFGNNTYVMFLRPEYMTLRSALVRLGSRSARAAEIARYLDANSSTLADVCSGAWQPSRWHRPTSLPSGICTHADGVGSYLTPAMAEELQQILDRSGAVEPGVDAIFTASYAERTTPVKTGTTVRTASGRVETPSKTIHSNVIELAPRRLSDFDPTDPETIDDPPLFDGDDSGGDPGDFDDICEACLLDPDITCPDYCQHGGQSDAGESGLPWGWIIVGVGVIGTAGYLISRK